MTLYKYVYAFISYKHMTSTLDKYSAPKGYLENIIDLMSPSLRVSFGCPTQNVKKDPSQLTLRVQTPIGYQPTLLSTIPIRYTLLALILTDLLNVISIIEFQLTLAVKWVYVNLWPSPSRRWAYSSSL